VLRGGELAATGARVQGLPVKAPLPALTVTAPVGLVAPLELVSVTVAVQVVAVLTVSEAGLQTTEVVVE